MILDMDGMLKAFGALAALLVPLWLGARAMRGRRAGRAGPAAPGHCGGHRAGCAPPPGPGPLRRAGGAGADRRRPGCGARLAAGAEPCHEAILLATLLLLGRCPAGRAQSVSIDLGAAGQPGATSRLVQLTALVGVLSLAPSLLVMATAFTRIVIVLSLLRSAIGAQGVPPNPALVGLALFLTLFVMQPVLEQAGPVAWSR